MVTWAEKGASAAAFIEKCLGFRDEALDLREKNDDLLAKCVASDREISFLREELESVRGDNARLGDENARLKARMSLGKTLFEEAETGSDIAERIGRGEPAFARGLMHEAVNADIQESTVNLETMEADMQEPNAEQKLRGLAALLGPKVKREPLPEFHDEPRRVEA